MDADQQAANNGQERHNENLRAENSGREQSRQESNGPDANPGNNLHIRNLSTQTTEVTLRDHFSAVGAIATASIPLDPHTKLPRGFAFVSFESNDDAGKAIETLDGSTLDGQVIAVAKARRARARTPTPGKFLGRDRERGGDRGGGGRDRDGRRPSRPYEAGRGDRYGGDRYERRDYDRGERGDRYSDRRDYRDRDRDREPRRDGYDRYGRM